MGQMKFVLRCYEIQDSQKTVALLQKEKEVLDIAMNNQTSELFTTVQAEVATKENHKRKMAKLKNLQKASSFKESMMNKLRSKRSLPHLTGINNHLVFFKKSFCQMYMNFRKVLERGGGGEEEYDASSAKFSFVL